MVRKFSINIRKLVSVLGLTLVQLLLIYSMAASQTVNGVVTDGNSGETLPGVNITVKGTTSGTSSGADGDYSLNVPTLSDTLIFSFIGYQTQEVPINSRTEINVTMQSEAIAGEELVVVGFGTQRSKNVITGISKVNSEQLRLKDQSTPTAAGLLKGRVSGVSIRETTGAAGSTPVVRIRGLSSINAGVEPLYVVDGFPVGNSFPQSLNPDEVENISVLKDAASTSIYGARGSNGVVLIETSNAVDGQSELSYNTHFGVQEVPESWRPNMLNAYEYAKFNKERLEELDAVNNPPTPTPIPQVFQDVLDNPDKYGEGTDWLDEYLTEGTGSLIQNHNLTYKNGNEQMQTVITGGFLNENGIVPNDAFQRLSLRTKFNASISEKTKLGVNVSGIRTENNRVNTDGSRSTLWAAVVGSPLQSPYNENGELKKHMPGDVSGYFSMPNPIYESKARSNTVVNREISANIDLNIELLEDLHYTPRVFGKQEAQKLDVFRPSTLGNVTIAREGNLAAGGPPQNNSAISQNLESENWGIDNLIRYTKSIQNHNFDFTIGHSIQKENAYATRLNGSVFPSDEVINFAEAEEVSTSNPVDYEWSLIAGFGRINYDFKEKYLTEINFRREGSSRLGGNNKFGNFPSGAIGWRVSDEKFYPEQFFIDEVLLRASAGKTGNSTIGNFDALGRLTSIPNPNNLSINNNYVLGDGVALGKSLMSLSNQSLQWETAVQYQIGANIGLWDNRISLVVDYFKKTTKNMLFNVDLPRSSGFSSTRLNIGEMENKGLEFEIQSFNISNDNFQWSSNFNASFLSNTVTDMPDQIDRIITGSTGSGANITKEGEEVGALYGLERLGFFNTEEELNNPDLVGWPGQKKLGAAYYRDQNGDGIINSEDLTVIGSPHPDVSFGFNNQLSYKNISLSILLTGMLGYEIAAATRDVDLNQVARWNVSKLVLDRWKSPDDQGAGFVPTSTVNPGSRQAMDDWLESGDHLWIKNFNVNYSLPANLLQRLGGIKNLRLYFSIKNLARIDNFSGFNPEVSANGGDPLATGIDVYTYPLSRSYTIGASITF